MAVNTPTHPPETRTNLSNPQVVAEKIKAKYPDAVESASAQGIVIKSDQ